MPGVEHAQVRDADYRVVPHRPEFITGLVARGAAKGATMDTAFRGRLSWPGFCQFAGLPIPKIF